MRTIALRSVGADASARLGEFLESLAERGRALLGRRAPDEARDLIALAGDLLEGDGMMLFYSKFIARSALGLG